MFGLDDKLNDWLGSTWLGDHPIIRHCIFAFWWQVLELCVILLIIFNGDPKETAAVTGQGECHFIFAIGCYLVICSIFNLFSSIGNKVRSLWLAGCCLTFGFFYPELGFVGTCIAVGIFSLGGLSVLPQLGFEVDETSFGAVTVVLFVGGISLAVGLIGWLIF